MIYLGIDPGKKGAIAAISRGGVRVESLQFNDDQIDASWLMRWLGAAVPSGPDGREPCMILLESINSFGMGRQSAFVFGQGFGGLQAVIELAGYPMRLVRPQAWQAVSMAGLPKDTEEIQAKRLFPDLDWPTSKDRREGWADALMIAEACRLTYGASI